MLNERVSLNFFSRMILSYDIWKVTFSGKVASYSFTFKFRISFLKFELSNFKGIHGSITSVYR